MKKTLKTTALAIALADSTALGMGTAFAADAVVTFDPGAVYHEWKHDRAPDMGWVEIHKK